MGEKGLNNLACIVRFDHPIDPRVLERAFVRLTRRHEILRSFFREQDGEVLEVVGEPLESVPFATLDCRPHDYQGLRGFCQQIFDLETTPLWHLGLFADPADTNKFAMALHHVVLDWVGLQNMIKDLAVLYASERDGTPANLPSDPPQSVDYLRWLAKPDQRLRQEEDRRYWRARLAQPSPRLRLPASNTMAPTAEMRRSRAVKIDFGEELSSLLNQFSEATGASTFRVLLAVYAAVLGRFGFADKVNIGTAVTIRNSPEIADIVGCLSDMIVLPCDLSGDPTFEELIQRINVSAAEDLKHRYLGFAELVDIAAAQRRSDGSQLYQAIFNFLKRPPESTTRVKSGPHATPISAFVARADFALELLDEGARISGNLEYREGLISSELAAAIAQSIVCMLRQGLATPTWPVGDLPMIESGDAAKIGDGFNPPFPAEPVETLGELFIARARRQPDDVALIEGAGKITYGALLDRSTALASALVARGLKPGTPVAICLDRSIDLAASMIATVLAGGVIVAFDTAYPAGRLASMLADCGAPILIANRRADWLAADSICSVMSPLAQSHPATVLPRVAASAPAYIVYTSGSTGRPKGVIGLHRGAVNRLRWMWEAYPFQPAEISVQKTSPAFVDFVWEFFGPLLAGIRSVIADASTALDPQALTSLMHDHQVSRVTLVPSLLAAWLETVPDLDRRLASLRVCVSSGEPLPSSLAKEFRTRLAHCRLLNLYGSSEVSADATWHELDGREGVVVPVGRPIPGNRISVVDLSGRSLPVGAPGEILVEGYGVAAGYLGNPEMSAERFGNAGSIDAKNACFRTGDVGFWDHEGRLVLLGRRDRQIKVRGVRIEPAEIETALLTHPGVRAAHVAACTDAETDETTLVGYVAADADVSEAALKDHLAQRLPRTLIPDELIVMDRLPLNANGKIDIDGLQAHPVASVQTVSRVVPLDPLEALVAQAWSAVLGKPVALAEADFFTIGGNSLRAVQAMALLGTALGRSLPVIMLFETPRLKELAQRLSDEREQDPDRALPPPRVEVREVPLPALVNQAWLWQEYQLDPRRVAYNLSIAYRIQGPLDVTALDRALVDLYARHEALRTRLAPSARGLVQLVDPPPASALEHQDVSTAADPDAALAAIVDAASRQPFALDRDLPLRCKLIKLGHDRFCLSLIIHHVASDGWSGQLLVGDLSSLYRHHRDGTPPPPAARMQAGDVAAWQHRIRPLLAERFDGYQASLSGAVAPRVAGLSIDGGTGGPVAIETVSLRPETAQALSALGQSLGATPFMIILAAWASLLSRFGGCERPMLGTTLAGRGHAGLQESVGFLANTFMLSVELDEHSTFEHAVAAARRALLAGLRYQDVPFTWILASGAGWPAGGEFLRNMLVTEDARAWEVELAGVKAELVSTPLGLEARSDVVLYATETHDGLKLRLEYATRRVPTMLAHRLARCFSSLLAAAAQDPHRPIGVLSLGEAAHTPPAELSAQPHSKADRIDRLVALQAAERPEAIAATDGSGTSMTFAALHRHADGVAARLQAIGVEPGQRVALIAASSPRQLASMIGILRAGAIVLPIDPVYPTTRIAETLADATVSAAISDGPPTYPCPHLRLDGEFKEEKPAAVPLADFAPAAIIYTSGTTGHSKGVLLEHAALCRLGAALAEQYALGPGDRILQLVSPAFDVALSNVTMALTAGAILVMPPRLSVMPGQTLRATMRDQAITHLQAPASILAETQPTGLPALRIVAVGGEVCPPKVARRWAEGRQLFIAYGPTEATVTASLARYDEHAHVATIGRPFAGARLSVIDPALAEVPVGVPGELCIAGANVAQGYLARPELTATKFVSDPAGTTGARRYRTGDVARREEDGTFTFLGRVDRQVKLRGFRIELGEVEAVIGARPGIERALAAVRETSDGDRRLVAWIVPTQGERIDIASLRQDLQSVLPSQLVPSAIVPIDAVPLTANGKVDWSVLPSPRAAEGAHDRILPTAPSRRPGKGQLACDVAAIWSALLDRSDIGPDENFFEIGGHSLLVVRLHEKLAEHFGVRLPIGELFAHPTLRMLTARLAADLGDTEPVQQDEDFIL
jgi:amino acid adenylation domain-containing protein